jgi:hypothetical protein
MVKISTPTHLLALYAFVWVIPRRLNFICQCSLVHTYPPTKVERTECSEMMACKIQKPGNYPEESIQHSEHGESLKSRIPVSLYHLLFHSGMIKNFLLVYTHYPQQCELQ